VCEFLAIQLVMVDLKA